MYEIVQHEGVHAGTSLYHNLLGRTRSHNTRSVRPDGVQQCRYTKSAVPVRDRDRTSRRSARKRESDSYVVMHNRFASMQTGETALKVPRSSASFIRFWFRRRKGFPAVEQLVIIADNGAPVEVDGVRDLEAALTYSNHRSIVPYSEQV